MIDQKDKNTKAQKLSTSIKVAAIAFSVSALILSGLIFYYLVTDKLGSYFQKEKAKLNGEFYDRDDQMNCPPQGVQFTHPPIDIDKIQYIVPLGNLNPSGHTFPTGHMYIHFDSPDNPRNGTEPIDVYAPTNAEIKSINIMTQIDPPPSYTDYSVDFSACSDFRFYYIHITSLSDKLQKAFDEAEGSEDCRSESPGGQEYYSCWKEVKVNVKAGEVIGKVGETTHINFDFGVTDLNLKPKIQANLDRWKNRGDAYTGCFTDYYPDDIKTQLEALLGGGPNEKRIIEPLCGTNAQDIPGTAQGVWFVEGTPMDFQHSEDEHMALVHHNIDPTRPVFSIGTSLKDIGIPSGTYSFEPMDSGRYNRDFDQVTADGNVYCYEVGGSQASGIEALVILIEMPDGETLRIAKGKTVSCKSGPWSMGSEYKVFQR